MHPARGEVTSPDWNRVWGYVAASLRDHIAAGRGGLLTEDTVRMCAILALQAEDVAPARLAMEVPASELSGGKLDLVLDPPAGVVIELKYPRDSRAASSPDTMTLGELIRDFLRVAAVPAQQRWVVQVVNARLQRYLTNLAPRHQIQWASATDESLLLDRVALEALPRTAINAIGPTPWLLPVTATCAAVEPVHDESRLFAYRVDAPQPSSVAASLRAATTSPLNGQVCPRHRGGEVKAAPAPRSSPQSSRHVELWLVRRRHHVLPWIRAAGGNDVTGDDMDLVAELLLSASERR